MEVTRRCVTDVTGLDALEKAWDRVLVQAATGNPFCSYAWCSEWWRTFGAGWRPEIYIWEHDGRVVGVLPLMRRRRLGFWREVRFMSGLAPERLDALVVDECRDAVGRDLPSLLRELCRTCDLLRFADLAPDGVLLAALYRAADQRDSHPVVLPSPPQAGVRVTGTFDEYFAERGQRLRRNFRRSCRELEKRLGAVPRSIDPTTPEDALAAFGAVWHLHRASFGRRRETDHFDTTRVERFHRAVIQRLARMGLVRFVTVASPSRVFGSTYCLVHRGRVFCYQLGFDPSVQELSPGFVAIGTAIRSAFASGCTYFDFLRGDEPYKYRWANAEHHTMLYSQSMDTIAGGARDAATGLLSALKKVRRALRRTS